MLPDNVFLLVFDFCGTDETRYNWWHALVHVCRRWRQVIFASPRRLNLRLLCTRKTPVRKNLGIWPAIPIDVCDKFAVDPMDEDNILAALEYCNRICKVSLKLTKPQLEKVAMAMQVPFPALSHLRISLYYPPHGGYSPPSPPSEGESPPDLPSEDEYDVPSSEDEYYMPSRDESRHVFTLRYLGGNASSLQKISFTGISFPALPALLLSANNLIILHLYGVYNLSAPGTLVAGLAATTRLEDLSIKFNCRSFPLSDNSAPPPSRTVLPALTRFQFHGDYTYLVNLVAQIDCPQLKFIDVRYSDEVIHPFQLIQFIGRSEVLELAPFRRAQVDSGQVSIDLAGSRAEPHPSRLKVEFPLGIPALREMIQLLIPASAMLTTVCHLSVFHSEYSDNFVYTSIADWIEFFRLFPAVETLHFQISWGSAAVVTSIDAVFDELMVAGALPALRFLSVHGPPTRSVLQFISARQASGCPVTLVKTREELKIHEACCETVGGVDKHTV